MHVTDIEQILRGIGAERVRIVSAEKIACACPLARWTHTKGSDSHPSCVVYVAGKHGDPIYSCQACHEQGSLRELLMFLWTKGRDTFHWIEALDSRATLDDANDAEKKRSEKYGDAVRASGKQGYTNKKPEPVAPLQHRAAGDDRPFYDYLAVAKADEIPEIPWSEYEPYVGKPLPQYVFDRGLTVETCREWELGSDDYSKRVLFPIRDRKGRLVTISGRLYVDNCPRCGGCWKVECKVCKAAPDDAVHADGGSCKFEASRPFCSKCEMNEPPKYLHRKGFERNLVLYGEHRNDETDGRVYIVEGHLDMLRMWQAGYRPVVAVLGTGVGETQVEKVIARWKLAIVVPDGDSSGADMGARFKKLVADRIKVIVKVLPDETDPGSLTPEQLEAVLGNPPSVLTKQA